MSMDGDERREHMWATYGQPEPIDAAAALAALGITDVDPKGVIAFRYRTRDAADAYAAVNIDDYGYMTLGTYSLGHAGIVGVIDIRPAIADMKRQYDEEMARAQANGTQS